MAKLEEIVDPEMIAFEDALLRSIDQAHLGEFAAVHSPDGWVLDMPLACGEAVNLMPNCLELT